MEPTKMLCKVDTVLKAMKGDVDVHEDPSLVRRKCFKSILPNNHNIFRHPSIFLTRI